MVPENPYKSSDAASDAASAGSPARVVGKVVAVGAVVLLLIALLLPARRGVREPARRNGCINNLRQIMLALRNYESEHGTLPPAYTVDADGQRLHSWRTLILPYLEERGLFASIDLSKPWDDPVNAEAREARVTTYLCPSSEHAPGLTTYCAVVGPDCVFSGSVPRELSEITDGLGKTMAVIDVNSDRAVHWMSPYDVTSQAVITISPKSNSNHSGLFVAGYLDVHIATLKLDSAPDKRRAMLTIAGGEVISD